MGVRHGTEGVTLRALTPADIPAAMRLKEAAGWNQTETDWRNALTLAPHGCFGIECDGSLRATVTTTQFQPELAWIGMMLTDPAYRGRGFAHSLMERAIESLRRQKLHWIKLDATDMGRPVYARFGFRDEAAIERWIRRPQPLPEQGRSPRPYVPDPLLDREAFGADRSTLLRVLSGIEAASIAGEGFAMGRPGSQAAYFGPCVARSADAAQDLAAWFLERHSKELVYWDILPRNREAIQIARDFGFERARELLRMALPGIRNPEQLKNNGALVFATAGFEYG
jgi:GNAT superfamily N-acetyltransferase